MFPERSDRIDKMFYYTMLLNAMDKKETVDSKWASDMIGRAFAYAFTASIKICLEKGRVPTKEEYQEEFNNFVNLASK